MSSVFHMDLPRNLKSAATHPAKGFVAAPKDMPKKADQGLSLDSKTVGALPIINHYLDRLGVRDLFDSQISAANKRAVMSHTDTLLVLIRNILVEREPIYQISEWAQRMDPKLLNINGIGRQSLGDDRFARSLDALFKADRATMTTQIVLGMIKEFEVDLSQMHNDSTSVAMTGKYDDVPSGLDGKKSIQPKYGHNKDHRPDLKQLLFSLTISRDGAVPVHFKAYDGNVTDDSTHIENGKTYVSSPKRQISSMLRTANCTHVSRWSTSTNTVENLLPSCQRRDRRINLFAVFCTKTEYWTGRT